jgi:hypothetical protein
MSLMGVDWLMSLDPHWYSTIYGLILVVGQGLSALSFAVAVLALMAPREPMNSVLRTMHFHDLGKLMLALVMLWAYFSFSQFLIIWAGNLPEEIPWYLRRFHGGWRYIGLFLVLFHFILPFLLLLSRGLKRKPRTLGALAAWVLFVRLVDLFWIVRPEFFHPGLDLHWLDIALPVGIGGIWLGTFFSQLRTRPLLPVGEPEVIEILAEARA